MKTILHILSFILFTVVIQAQTVVDVIVNSPDHNTLEAAVIAADLAGTLSGDGPFTVFAPTDAAFAALPEGTVDDLLADIPALTAILTYHVVGATVLSTDLSDGQVASTLNGKDITVTINADGIFINDAQVTVADFVTDNGVVHVIDAVLLPPPVSSTTNTNDFVTFSVYPNPVTNFVNIKTNANLKPQNTLECVTTDGKVIQVWNNITTYEMIDVQLLSKGTYYLRYRDEALNNISKIIVE